VKKDRHSSHSVIVALLGEGKGQRLLDVGAAQGDMAQVLTTHGYEVTALEGDPTLAEMARRKCHKVIVADLDYSLPNLEGPFDVVLCADVLEHLKNQLRVLVDLRHQLKPEGVAVVSVPNAAHLWVRLQLCLGRFDYAERGVLDRTHLRFFTLSSFRRLLREAGLTVLKLTTTPAPLPLVVPERYHGRMLDTVHGMSAFVAHAGRQCSPINSSPGRAREPRNESEGCGGDAGIQRGPHAPDDLRGTPQRPGAPCDP